MFTKFNSGANLDHHNVPSENSSSFPNLHGSNHSQSNIHQQNLPHLTNQHHMINNNHSATNDAFNAGEIDHQRRLKVTIHLVSLSKI